MPRHGFNSSYPARGRKRCSRSFSPPRIIPSSIPLTPQGDGNTHRVTVCRLTFIAVQFLLPRKGTETSVIPLNTKIRRVQFLLPRKGTETGKSPLRVVLCPPFNSSYPARGRKPQYRTLRYPGLQKGSIPLTPQGDGNLLPPKNIPTVRTVVQFLLPRKGTETMYQVYHE